MSVACCGTGGVAQRLEQPAHNGLVAGSNPAAPIGPARMQLGDILQIPRLRNRVSRTSTVLRSTLSATMAETRQQAHIPFALQEAVVQACGTVFWYKDPLKKMLARSGVPRPLISAHGDAAKFLMVRQILAELDTRGVAGARVQHQIVRELAAMRTVQDPDNREAGLNALADLRAIATEHGVIEDKGAKPADDGAKRRRAAAADKERVAKARRKGLSELHEQFTAMATRPDEAQKRGYDLQDLLATLFRLHEHPLSPAITEGHGRGNGRLLHLPELRLLD
jgi:hypothetical protein